MFLEAPKDALTVKVGPGDTAARPSEELETPLVASYTKIIANYIT